MSIIPQLNKKQRNIYSYKAIKEAQRTQKMRVMQNMNGKMADINTMISTITLNVNRQNDKI